MNIFKLNFTITRKPIVYIQSITYAGINNIEGSNEILW